MAPSVYSRQEGQIVRFCSSDVFELFTCTFGSPVLFFKAVNHELPVWGLNYRVWMSLCRFHVIPTVNLNLDQT